MEILKETQTRSEYKRIWIALKRASQHGLNTGLLDAFFSKALEQGYDLQTARAAVYYAAKNGVFGYLNAWER